MAAERIFCVPGESFLDVLDALHDQPAIDLVVTKHEGAAANMAEADGKLTGRPGICFGHPGAGRHARQHRRAYRPAGLHAHDPVRGADFPRPQGSGGVPGGGLRGCVRHDGQVGGRDRRSGPDSRDGGARLPGGHVRPARPGVVLALPEDVLDDLVDCADAEPYRTGGRPARRGCPGAGRRAGRGAPAAGDCRRRRLDRRRGARLRRLRQGVEPARGLRLPPTGRHRQPRPALHRPPRAWA